MRPFAARLSWVVLAALLVAVAFALPSAAFVQDESNALTPAQPVAERGGGTDSGVYAPPLAGPGGTIAGTFEDAEASGPSGYYVATVDAQGKRSFFKGLTDATGRFRFVVPADAVALDVFRHFDAKRRPDTGSHCVIDGSPLAHVGGTTPFGRLPAKGPAIVAAIASYQRGKALVLQTRGIDPSDAALALDGDDARVVTLAASALSVVGRVAQDAPLGHRAVSVRSSTGTTNDAPADIVDVTTTTSGAHETGAVQTVTLNVVGLSRGDAAVARFHVGGNLQLENGGTDTTVPVENGVATIRVRGVQAGESLVQWTLVVTLANEVVAQETEPPATPKPKPTPAPTKGAIARTTPEPKETPKTPPAAGSEYVSCTYKVVDGYMQPTQGFWQDDKAFPSPNVLMRFQDEPSYKAPYPLVAGRPTVIGGVYHYRFTRGGDVFPDDRDTPKGHIVVVVSSNCESKPWDEVRFHFAFVGPPGVVWKNDTAPLGTVPLHGTVPKGTPPKTYSVSLPAPLGYPTTTAFTANVPGYYTLFCNLERRDAATGFWKGPLGDVSVNVELVQTHGPYVLFAPVVLAAYRPDTAAGLGTALEAAARPMAFDTALRLPDLFPLIPADTAKTSPIQTSVATYEDFTADDRIQNPEKYVHVEPEVTAADPDLDAFLRFVGSDKIRRDEVIAGLGLRFELETLLSGAGRIVAVFNHSDWVLLGNIDKAGLTHSSKVILVPDDANWETIGHELVHTLPWDARAGGPGRDVGWMQSECARGYHNLRDAFAQGLRFIRGLRVSERTAETGRNPGMMGPLIVGKPVYIEQCTSRHLTQKLRGIPDPPVIVVRGLLLSDGKTLLGRFAPFYTFDGNLDREAPDEHHLHVVLRNTNGRALADVPFAAHFVGSEDTEPRLVTSFMVRVPALPGVASIELRSGDRVLATRTMSAAAPRVTIEEPAVTATHAPNAPIHLTWRVQSAQRGPFVSSVSVSSDGGKIFEPSSFETHATSYDLRLSKAGRYVIRVVVSDGSRSGQADRTIVVGS